jgi:hypothetical protein
MCGRITTTARRMERGWKSRLTCSLGLTSTSVLVPVLRTLDQRAKLVGHGTTTGGARWEASSTPAEDVDLTLEGGRPERAQGQPPSIWKVVWIDHDPALVATCGAEATAELATAVSTSLGKNLGDEPARVNGRWCHRVTHTNSLTWTFSYFRRSITCIYLVRDEEVAGSDPVTPTQVRGQDPPRSFS